MIRKVRVETIDEASCGIIVSSLSHCLVINCVES